MKNSRVFLGIALSLVAACSMVKKGGSTGGGGGGEAKGPLGDTMADGVVYERGATITAPLGCHTSGYAKLAIPAGESIQLEVSVASPNAEQACLGIGFLKENGGDAGLSEEVCSDAPESYTLTAPAGGPSFLQVSENGVCQGATMTVVVK